MCVLACIFLAAPAQEQADNYEWYLDEVVSDVFVNRNDFEYYYVPSAADMDQQRRKGEVTYFLNTPPGFSTKKAKDIIDRLMASYDDIKAVGDWHFSSNNYWKEFRNMYEYGFAPGDVNHDGLINVADVMATSNNIIGNQNVTFFKEQADVNHDGYVNVADISEIVNIVMSNNSK